MTLLRNTILGYPQRISCFAQEYAVLRMQIAAARRAMAAEARCRTFMRR